ncbi:MAG: ribonuclease R [Chitinophagaceae bacterium]
MAKNKKRKVEHPFSPAVVGVIDISRHGMGFVKVDGMEVDIKINRENTKQAMSGDTVEVSIFKIGKTSKRPEGLVTKIKKRAQTDLIGTVQKTKNFAFVIPDNKSFTKDIFIPEKHCADCKDGDRVIVKITHWTEQNKNPEGIITEILSAEKESSIAMKEIILQQGFNLVFPQETLDELISISGEIQASELAHRIDLRDTFTITIDPFDAKDFDDAISIKKLENNNYEIGVHIADVAHFVASGTALDKEAYHRATSVYLPDRVVPMLPEKISNELCSLRPHEDKYTFSVLYEMDAKGQVKKMNIAKTIIHSNHRFTYEEVQDIIEKNEGLYVEEIKILHTISQTLRKERFKNGAINFTSEEARFILDEDGVPNEVMIKESKESHQLVEEFMLLANKTVATFIHDKKHQGTNIPFPYRIHDTPDVDRLKTFADFALHFGHKFNVSTPASIAKSFNEMILNSHNIPEQQILHTLGIRTMAKAEYATQNIGHYGLAFDYYCHFTSPIRRYPDVLVHRILHAYLEKKPLVIKDLEKQCVYCSERERKAMDAERDAIKYKQVEYMQKFIGEELVATISGVAAFGFWALTTNERCEGFISIQTLKPTDQWTFVEEKYALVNNKTKQVYQIGQGIQVKIIAANLYKKQIDMELV